MLEPLLAEQSIESPWDESLQIEWKPLYLFNLYRLTLVLVFIATFLLGISPFWVGQYNPSLFFSLCWFYFAFALISLQFVKRRAPAFSVQVFTQIFIDIILSIFIMHSSGGLNSGTGVLLVIAVIAGGLLTPGRTAFFFAALASIGVLLHSMIANTYHWFSDDINYSHAGILGIAFFLMAFLSYYLGQRVRQSEILARERGLQILYLQRLNAQIVQNIRSGIIVVDAVERIRLLNEAALRLLQLKITPLGYTLETVSPPLYQQFQRWRSNPHLAPQLLSPPYVEVGVLATFMELAQDNTASVLIVLEDATLTSHRAQQLKLASVGRLTASIAHEIRNPLSVIGQAGQLLQEQCQSNETAEFPELDIEQTARLSEMIVKNTRRVNKIIEAILQISRRKEPDLQLIDLHQWLIQFIDEFNTCHALKNNEICLNEYSEALYIYFDNDQLHQVLTNLCENGLRYSHQSPCLSLKTGISHDFRSPYLDIIDFGEGIPPSYTAQLFEPFFTTEKKGTGLGLYVSREICEANKAMLSLISNSKEGCCFRILFRGR